MKVLCFPSRPFHNRDAIRPGAGPGATVPGSSRQDAAPGVDRKIKNAPGLIIRAIAWLSFAFATSAIAADGSAAEDTGTPPHVFGTPRLTQGHPRTLWDPEDIAHYQQLLQTSPELKTAYHQLRAFGDKRILEPLEVPAHVQETDGKWSFPDFKRGYQDPEGKLIWEWKFNGELQRRSADVANLGILYAFSGEEKYAAFAKKLLLALVDAYGYRRDKPLTDQNGHDHFEAYGFDGGDAAMLLIKTCFGYDLIYNSPAMVPNERRRIEDDLFRPMVEHLKQAKWMFTGHDKWGMICLYGIFLSGVTLDDRALIQASLYGLGGNPEKPDGGFLHCFDPSCMRPDGRWQPNRDDADQFATLSVLVSVAEVMWHHGTDLYSHQQSALKRPFDRAMPPAKASPIDAEYRKLLGLTGIHAFEYAYRRYRDPRYLPLIRMLKPALAVNEPGELPSLFEHGENGHR
jgi:hypothetical protein